MTLTPNDEPAPAIPSSVDEWTQPVWLHPSPPAGPPGSARPPAALGDFARLAAPIALAAWMFGTALTSSCAPADMPGWSTTAMPRAGRAGEPGVGGPRSAPPAQAVAVSGH